MHRCFATFLHVDYCQTATKLSVRKRLIVGERTDYRESVYPASTGVSRKRNFYRTSSCYAHDNSDRWREPDNRPVQQRTSSGDNSNHTASRSRGALLRHAGRAIRGSIAQTKWTPAHSARFIGQRENAGSYPIKSSSWRMATSQSFSSLFSAITPPSERQTSSRLRIAMKLTPGKSKTKDRARALPTVLRNYRSTGSGLSSARPNLSAIYPGNRPGYRPSPIPWSFPTSL